MEQVTTPSHTLISLPPLELEAGGQLSKPVASIWWWGPPSDSETLADHGFQAERRGDALTALYRGSAELEAVRSAGSAEWQQHPTILIVHALTGDRRAGGGDGWWEGVVGPGLALDPTKARLICINQLGSCYGSSGPGDEGFPTWQQQHPDVGGYPGGWPATITPRDQANFLHSALDELGLGHLDAVIGGSVGGAIAQSMVALRPERADRLISIASSMAASPWIIGFNHIARHELKRAWPQGHEARVEALKLARRLAHLSYRAEPGLELRQGRRHRPEGDGGWQSGAPYAAQTYLDYHADRLAERFSPEAYVAQIDAMDHHDLTRLVGTNHANKWAKFTSCVAIDTDALYLPEQSQRMVRWLEQAGHKAQLTTLTSLHGHDAFLIELDQMSELISSALNHPL